MTYGGEAVMGKREDLNKEMNTGLMLSRVVIVINVITWAVRMTVMKMSLSSMFTAHLHP